MEIHIGWGKLLRRTLALTTAAGAICLLAAGARSEPHCAPERRPVSDRFAEVALRVEMGSPWTEPMSFWEQMAIRQSPLLAANPPRDRPSPPLPNAQPAPDRDDLVQNSPPPPPDPGTPAVERTLVPASPRGYVTGGGLYLYNRSGLDVDLSQAAASPLRLPLEPAERGPQVLIIHTHATEAYAQTQEDPYVPTDANARTLDPDHSVIRVGEEISRVLTEMGLSVLHDTGVYDYPRYNGSYGRSGPSVAAHLKEHPTIQLVLDIHRDALVGEDGTIYKAVTTIDGIKTAQVMLVVGTDAGGTAHPRWRENLALAARLQHSLDTLYPTLARPIALRKSAYNQEQAPGSLLVEVGCHGNTLPEALAGARLFARAAGSCLLEDLQGSRE